MTENTRDLVKSENLNDKVNSKFIQLIKSEEYPLEVREGVNEVMNIIGQEKSITDLYPEELAEIPISQSHFQDQAVQYSQHFTSHKKLRQALMEMQDRINALYAAKTGQKKAILKVKRIEFEMENLYKELEKAKEDAKTTRAASGKEPSDYEIRRWELTISEKEVDQEEAERGLKDASHLIKDAILKVDHQRKLVDRYKKEVEESGLSYEESEAVYYVMYFTSEAENQLRTGDHQIDRGTNKAIAQMPEVLRKKIQSNISFLREKLFGDDPHPVDGDYLFIIYRDQFEPKKTGPGEFEGMKLEDFLGIQTIKLLSKEE